MFGKIINNSFGFKRAISVYIYKFLLHNRVNTKSMNDARVILAVVSFYISPC